MVSGIYFDILSSILCSIDFDIFLASTLKFFLAYASGISSDILSGILSSTSSDFVSGILSGISSDILCG